MEYFSGLSDTADAEGFLVVYPWQRTHGSILTWNAGNCCGSAQEENVDDVEFVRRLVDDLDGNANVDADRVFATGMSNGAILTYRLASEPPTASPLLPVAGPMGPPSAIPGAQSPSCLSRHGRQIAPLGMPRRKEPVENRFSFGGPFDRVLGQRTAASPSRLLWRSRSGR
jgi:polyhydroxybutyrate depolymerase